LRALSKSEINESFAAWARLGNDYVQCDERGLFFVHPEAKCLDLEYPAKLERLPFLARLLGTLGYDDADFEGALIWFTDWGVWNARDEAPGYRVIEAMNAAVGQPISFEAAPGHSFRGDELTNAVAMLLQPMIFGWDAYYFPRWSFGVGEFFLYVSHDSYVSVVTRTTAFYEKAFAILRELDLHPKEGHELRRNRFCRASSVP
jgi:hypothetical protein